MMRRPEIHAVVAAVDGDGRNPDRRLRGEPRLDPGVGRVAGDQPEPMPVGMDRHVDEVGRIEGLGRAFEGRLVERPGRRPEPPQEPGDPAPVLRQADPAPLAVEIVLAPERRLLGRRRRVHRAGDVLDRVGIARDQRHGPLRPQRRNDAGRPAAPAVAGEDRALDAERVQKRQEVGAQRRLLARARRVRIEKAGRPEAAQPGNDHPRSRFGENRGDRVISPDVIGESVSQHARPAVGGAVRLIGDPEGAGVDRLGRHRHVLAPFGLRSRRPCGRFGSIAAPRSGPPLGVPRTRPGPGEAAAPDAAPAPQPGFPGAN